MSGLGVPAAKRVLPEPLGSPCSDGAARHPDRAPPLRHGAGGGSLRHQTACRQAGANWRTLRARLRWVMPFERQLGSCRARMAARPLAGPPATGRSARYRPRATEGDHDQGVQAERSRAVRPAGRRQWPSPVRLGTAAAPLPPAVLVMCSWSSGGRASASQESREGAQSRPAHRARGQTLSRPSRTCRARAPL